MVYLIIILMILELRKILNKNKTNGPDICCNGFIKSAKMNLRGAKMKKPIIAIMYDFDKTLCTRDMQEYTFIPSVGMKAEEFWQLSNVVSTTEEMDSILARRFGKAGVKRPFYGTANVYNRRRNNSPS